MNSCVYISKISHQRFFPKKNAFQYNIYMAYLDLDELAAMDQELACFSYNRWNMFAFYDRDHFKFLRPGSPLAGQIARENIDYDPADYAGQNTKDRLVRLISDLGLGFEPAKIFVLTNLRNFGYIFNPVSFYYCYDAAGRLRAMFSEVNNTFHDQKMYYTLIDDPDKNIFQARQVKNFYISPFISPENELSWQFQAPGESLLMAIDSRQGGQVELKTVLAGRRQALSNAGLARLQLRYPLITLMIIILIHYQAAKLFAKKLKYYRKDATDKKIAAAIAAK